VDLVDLVGGYLTLKRAGSSFKACCPFHEEKTPSFHIWPDRQVFKCFGCNAGGDVFTFVQLREKVDFLEARRMLAERAGVSLEAEYGSGVAGEGTGHSKSDLARVNTWAQRAFRQNYLGQTGAIARDYVEKRQISTESAERFGLGLAVDSFDSLIRQAERSKVAPGLLVAAGLVKERQTGGYYDTFRHRLMFPIIDVGGRIIGFGGRTLGDDPAKYLNTPTTPLFDKSANLFGLDQARQGIAQAGRAVVVEGYTDCIMAHQCGFPETVATLGTAMTENHARLLKRYTDRVILLFDSDEAGQKAADRALAVTISVGLDVAMARVPSGKDPCDYLLSAGKTEFERLLNQAVGALEFKWNCVSGRFNASDTGPGRRRAVDEYLQQLADWIARGAIDPIQVGLLLNQLGKILSLPPEELHRQIKVRSKSRPGRTTTASSGNTASDNDEDRSGRTPGPTRAEQRAYREIVEVLLNAPAHYPAVAAVLDPARVEDPALSSIAREMRSILEACRPFRIDELIGRLESPGYARLITDLQLQGERRGGYRRTIEGAVTCLMAYPQVRRAAQYAQEIRSHRVRSTPVQVDRESPRDGQMAGQSGSPDIPEGEDERLQALAAGVRVSHFATIRARTRFLQEGREHREAGDEKVAEAPGGQASEGASASGQEAVST
jgi:DNA primase